MPKQDKWEWGIFLFLLISLGFIQLNYDLSIGTILLIMIVTSVLIFLGLPARITHNSKTGNTLKSAGLALISLGVIIISTLIFSTVFQGALVQEAEPTLQSIGQAGFSSLGFENIVPQSSQPIFSDSIILMIFTFGVLIAMVETRFIARIMEGLASVFSVSLERFDFKVIFLFALISSVFVFYHFNAKGVTNNVALLLTFVFAFISLELVRRTKELESATYLHVFNNLLYIVPRANAQLGG